MGKPKRSLSQRSSTTEMDQDVISTSTLRSSLSLSNYRLISLKRARIVVQHRGLPEHVQSRVDSIIQPGTFHERDVVLSSIIDSLCDAFPKVLEVASREDDSVELIYGALDSMNNKLFSKLFSFRRKAGITDPICASTYRFTYFVLEWEPTLKPYSQRKSYRSNPPDKPTDKPTDSTNSSPQQPGDRQQIEQSHCSPEKSETMMPPPPPPLPPKQDGYSVKTPRPDITIGFLHSVVTSKLRSLGLGELDAEELLEDLQYDQELYSSPTEPALLIPFPSIVVEGKSYGTGKSIYEAENQAAVSGSCMLVVQHQLDDLAARRSLGSHESREPLAFSICSEGPIMLLWVHYTTSVEGTRFYNMHLLETCHATCRKTVETFFIAVAGIMRWASSELLDDIAEQLFLVWKSAQQQAA